MSSRDIPIEPLPADGQTETPTYAYVQWPQPLDLRELANIDPVTPPMIINDWLPAGYATLLAGHGGAGKSAIALHLAVCIATGKPFFGLEVGQRRVLYLSCEDRVTVLHWRFARICSYLEMNISDLAGQLDVLDLVGHETLLYQRDPMANIDLTAAYGQLGARMRELGTEVLILDGVSDVFGGNENDRGQVKQFVNALIGLIPPDRGAVLLVAHVNKPTASAAATTEGYSGSTAWHNAVRARWYLRPEFDDTDDGREATGDLLLELQKSNLGRTDQALRFRWDDDAHMFVGEPEGGISEFDRRARDRNEQDAIVAALRSITEVGDYCPAAAQGPRTAYRVLSACPEFPEGLKGGSGRKRFWRHVEHLRRNRIVREGSIRRGNRHSVATLEPGPASDVASEGASNAPDEYDAPPNKATQGAPAPNASHSTGGYRGSARTHTTCRHCGGDGCHWCSDQGTMEAEL